MLEYIKRLVKPINAFSGFASKDYFRPNSDSTTKWITYEMIRNGKHISVPIYELTDRESKGWKRVGPKVL